MIPTLHGYLETPGSAIDALDRVRTGIYYASLLSVKEEDSDDHSLFGAPRPECFLGWNLTEEISHVLGDDAVLALGLNENLLADFRPAHQSIELPRFFSELLRIRNRLLWTCLSIACLVKSTMIEDNLTYLIAEDASNLELNIVSLEVIPVHDVTGLALTFHVTLADAIDQCDGQLIQMPSHHQDSLTARCRSLLTKLRCLPETEKTSDIADSHIYMWRKIAYILDLIVVLHSFGHTLDEKYEHMLHAESVLHTQCQFFTTSLACLDGFLKNRKY